MIVGTQAQFRGDKQTTIFKYFVEEEPFIFTSIAPEHFDLITETSCVSRTNINNSQHYETVSLE